MCGINGIAHPVRNGRAVSRELIEKMRDVLVHRGPDERGAFVEGTVGLGHRRLSIVDLSSGQQPMTNEDGSLQIVYNGEIYNHADYREKLEAVGHKFATRCDTETILHLYEEYGRDCVRYLRGMFAFAIWDRRRKALFLARDRLGVKPLYYVHSSDGSLYFASEIKALLAAGAIKAELEISALPDYLANRCTSDDRTMFKGVKRLPPGHILHWAEGKLEIGSFWDLPLDNRSAADGSSRRNYVAEWRDLFEESVRLRLMADVPLGMFLSGGIDSSAIAAVMRKMVSEPIKTFSVAFDVPEANELEFARSVAQALGTDHHEVMVTPQQFAEALPRLVWHEDEPIAHSASVALYFVSQLAQRYVKVVLTGEGSDELLAGYYRYRTTIANLRGADIYSRITTPGIRRAVQVGAGYVLPGRISRKLKRTFLWRQPDIESIYFDNFSVFPMAQQLQLFSSDALSQVRGVNPYSALNAYFAAGRDTSLLRRLLYTDAKSYLHELLMKQDQMSMAASIESRVPFLDHKLVEFSTHMPDEWKLNGWTTKRVLREAMKGVIPDSILTRKKMGFPVPLARWFRREFRPQIDEYILSARAQARGLFAAENVRQLVAEHQEGHNDHADKLWSLMNLEIWHRIFVDGDVHLAALPIVPEHTSNPLRKN